MSDELHASALLRWPESITDLESRQVVAARAAEHVEAGQLIGVGSGADAYLALSAIAGRASERQLDIAVVCTSYEAETAAATLGLSLMALGSAEPDWGIDGADEVDSDNRLLKRRGGALPADRLLWATVKRMYLAVHPGTFVETLGRRFPLPVEVHRDAVTEIARELGRLGAGDVQLRLATGKDGPVFTAGGNLLLDARFPELAPGVAAEVKALAGVIETGLFEGYEFETL